jgi:hypothetical protein
MPRIPPKTSEEGTNIFPILELPPCPWAAFEERDFSTAAHTAPSKNDHMCWAVAPPLPCLPSLSNTLNS